MIPHYAYARSDKKDASRISLGGRLVADMLTTAGVDRVLTMTLHAPQVHGFFSVPVDHLTALGVLADHFRGQDLTDTVVVSPDLGNAKTATQFARLLGLPVAAGSKQRLADDRVVIDAIVGDVDGKRAIVLDDEIATGGSIVELLDKLGELGCTGASVACTHGLFVGKAVDRLRDHPIISEVVTTDTVPPRRLAGAAGALGGRPVRRGDQPGARGRVGQQPVRRRRPHAGPAAAPSCRSRPERRSVRRQAARRTPPARGPPGTGRLTAMLYEVTHTIVPPVAKAPLAPHGRGARQPAGEGPVIVASNHLSFADSW